MVISGLSIKITAPIVIISALAIGLTAFLNLGKFERTFSELERSRIRFVVNDLRANLETGLGLGLALKGLANAQAVIESEAKSDPSILSISLYDESGTVVFHTGEPLPSNAVPPGWKSAASAKEARDWQLLEDDALVVGTSLASVIGVDAGGMALRYSRKAHDSVVDSVAESLKLAAVLGTLLTGLIAMLGISLIIIQTNRKLTRIEQSLRDIANDQPPTPAGEGGSEADALIDSVVTSTRAAMQDLAGTQKILKTRLSAEAAGKQS